MAYRSARHAGAMDHGALMAAIQACEGHQLCDSEAGGIVNLMIQVAIERATEWFSASDICQQSIWWML